ncbi:MAG TPA: hybrid sensor histidine kinase/response regulator [Verrucomicrobium sp.]|nr:hybrid sensor histidine kinase/response regulator [Verrucomicrobium sp.]
MQSPSSGSVSTGLILVVDDQVRNLQMVKGVLTQSGFEVITAASGQEAMFCLAARTPDLILLDVIMPGIDGFEVCRQIKSNRATQDIPVIFLSGSSDQPSIMKGFETGGVDYVTKPFNKSELLARVHTHVELLHAQRRHATQLQDKSRTLGIIAEEWHQPLQRIALLTKQLTSHVGTRDAVLVNEATTQLERMLLSVERFLQAQSLQEAGDSGSSAMPERLTSNLETLAGRWYLTAKRKCVDLRIQASASDSNVAASPFAARQIVDALLSNAINYTPRDGFISVYVNRSADLVNLLVEDNGEGFPHEYLRNPFQPHVKPASAGAQTPSLGLGLAAAKRTADRIGASLSITNSPAGGARVSVTFHTPPSTTSTGSPLSAATASRSAERDHEQPVEVEAQREAVA